jgi:hypothetical protein
MKRIAEILEIDLKAAGIERQTDVGLIDFPALRAT